ncbi:MAG: NADPH-dependent 7-cyano-7-deazaguanine reductase QueF [Rickettsiaceae bacterium]|nr:NADPH-dependent 7-cyano-7-deazaguanine reductase QueF [Rickettsiaceae bacterium]
MANLVLGQGVLYPQQYDPTVLFPIPRIVNRVKIKLGSTFYGYDIWNCYEISWLNSKGKPEVRIAEIFVSSDSPSLIESKSLKLYFFSFNNERFESEEMVRDIMIRDISRATGKEIVVKLKKISELEEIRLSKPDGICIDDLDIEISAKHSSAKIIKIENQTTEETIYSNLHKTNCLITHQPDWATVIVSYKGPKINHASFLEYIISHRDEDMFHEDSVEKIYADLLGLAKFEKILVEARYTRRGGIDINPIRANFPIDINNYANLRLARQ